MLPHMSMSISVSFASPSTGKRLESQSSHLVAWKLLIEGGGDVETTLDPQLDEPDGRFQYEWREACRWSRRMHEGTEPGEIWRGVWLFFCAEKSIASVFSTYYFSISSENWILSTYHVSRLQMVDCPANAYESCCWDVTELSLEMTGSGRKMSKESL